MTDRQIINALVANLEWDGHGYWLPELCIKEMAFGEDFCKPPTRAEMIEALEAALSADQPIGEQTK